MPQFKLIFNVLTVYLMFLGFFFPQVIAYFSVILINVFSSFIPN